MMNNISLARIREIFPQFNKKQLTERDFWRAAKRAGIVVRRHELLVRGCYFMEAGRHFIFIDSRLSGLEFLHTAFHEFCHYLFDVPTEHESAFYDGRLRNERERFADAFALAALIPFPELIRTEHEELIGNPWLSRIVADRTLVYTKYGI